MRKLTSFVGRCAVAKRKRESKTRRSSRQARTMALGVLAAAALSAAQPVWGQTTPIFTTQDDWSTTNLDPLTAGASGWAAQNGSTIALNPTTLFDADNSSVNGAGNFASPGGTGTPGSMAITYGGGNSFGAVTEISNEFDNTAFMAAFDPGGTPAAAVAYNGLIQITYTQPVMPAGDTFGLGILLQYPANGFFGRFLATSTSVVNTGTNTTGLTEMKATIPYSITAGSMTALGFGIIFNTNAPAGTTVNIDNLTMSPVPAAFGVATASWLPGNGAWETAANWSSNPTVPGALGSQVTFGVPAGTPTSHPVVTLGQSATVTLLDLQSPDGGVTSGYTINNGNAGSITVTAQIEADSGVHAINIPLAFGGPAAIYVAPGASITVPNASNSGQFGTFALTNTDGSTLGGTFSEGGMQFCGIDDNGTWNILSSMQTVNTPTSSTEFFATTLETGGLLNVGSFNINTNGLFSGAGGGGTVNIGAGGSLQVGFFNTTSFYSGSFTGSGSLLFTGLVFNSGTSGARPQYLFWKQSRILRTYYRERRRHFGRPGSKCIRQWISHQYHHAGQCYSAGHWFNHRRAERHHYRKRRHDRYRRSYWRSPGERSCSRRHYNESRRHLIHRRRRSAHKDQFRTIDRHQHPRCRFHNWKFAREHANPNERRNCRDRPQRRHLGRRTGRSQRIKLLTIVTDASGNYISTLDLTNNSMIIKGAGSAGAATVQAEIAVGRNNNPTNGVWTGTGITSSTAATVNAAVAAHTSIGPQTALGMELNDNGSGQPLLTTFEGQTVADGDVLVKYTFAGDADLSGHINATDYMLIDTGFASGGTKTGWRNGDFNYDGQINGDDYTLIDNSFNTQGSLTLNATSAGPAEQIASAAVPEPATLSLIGFSAAGLMMRRRRKI